MGNFACSMHGWHRPRQPQRCTMPLLHAALCMGPEGWRQDDAAGKQREMTHGLRALAAAPDRLGVVFHKHAAGIGVVQHRPVALLEARHQQRHAKGAALRACKPSQNRQSVVCNCAAGGDMRQHGGLALPGSPPPAALPRKGGSVLPLYPSVITLTTRG